MIKFVNAKINIGLQIVRKRPDGYHDLQTVFYPVGINAGTDRNPISFCDILELVPGKRNSFGLPSGPHPESLMPEIIFKGRKIDCEPDKNLVYKAADLFCRETGANLSGYRLILDKHLPDGAGMGGGSADAAFTLSILADFLCKLYPENPISEEELLRMGLALGADCPFFIINRPCYAEGVGERLEELPLSLTGYCLLVVKPAVYISTREAFAGVTPAESNFDLRDLPSIPVEEWKGVVKNDFEDSIFPKFPLLADIKESLYRFGAAYASLTGSGSCIYGIFKSTENAEKARIEFDSLSTIEAVYLLK
ncbi:MAG: 4-(cytidine 5'-diphospho)-2-C-methyl-D-erythritol kinase [Muribaculaceae bacterium]|nr:4-(cytidine 5'-diphospho)-2-C-methyl-D-erythritol kinase [Muribaculaceae bacterium]